MLIKCISAWFYYVMTPKKQRKTSLFSIICEIPHKEYEKHSTSIHLNYKLTEIKTKPKEIKTQE